MKSNNVYVFLDQQAPGINEVIFKAVYKLCDGNLTRVSKIMGVSTAGLYVWINKWELDTQSMLYVKGGKLTDQEVIEIVNKYVVEFFNITHKGA